MSMVFAQCLQHFLQLLYLWNISLKTKFYVVLLYTHHNYNSYNADEISATFKTHTETCNPLLTKCRIEYAHSLTVIKSLDGKILAILDWLKCQLVVWLENVVND